MRVVAVWSDRKSVARSWHLGVMAGLLLVTACGCDLGTYGSRYRDRLPELQRRSELSQQIHGVATPLDSTDGRSAGVGLRFPVLFDGETVRYSTNDLGAKPTQAQPPQIPVPGLLFTYEKHVSTPSGDALPVYAYVGSGDGAVELEAVAAEIEQAVEAVVGQDLNWETISLNTLSGTTVTWQRLRVSSAQPFMVRSVSGEEVLQTLEGQLLFYLSKQGDVNVVLAWRYPSQLADQIGFPAGVEASVATLK